MKYGIEYRSFYNNAHNAGTGGLINFSSLQTFLAGQPVRTSVQVGAVTPALSHRSVSFFAQDDYKVTRRLTLNLGLRYEYNSVPSERHNYLAVYDFTANQLVQVGVNGAQLYAPDRLDFGPRVGMSLDLTGKGRTVLRAGGGIYYDQALLSTVSGAASNHPSRRPFCRPAPRYRCCLRSLRVGPVQSRPARSSKTSKARACRSGMSTSSI